MLKKLLLIASLLASPAFGQSVQYVTPVTRNTVPVWNTNGVIAGGVSSADSPVSSFGVTNNGGAGICDNSGRQASAGYQALCLGFVSGVPTISVQNYGTAAAEPLQFVINGTTYAFPGSLSNITIGTTPVVGGTTGLCLFVTGGVVGQQACTLSAITSLTGDVTATGPGISAATLATVNSSPGTYGSSAAVPIVTVNSKGLVTSVTTTAFGITVGSTSIATGTTNGLLYDNGGLLGNLATLGNGILVTSSGGAPSISTTLPSGITIPGPTFSGTVTFPDSATWTSNGISKVAALSAGSATLPSAGNISISGLYEVNGTQIAASNLSNGTTGSGAVVLAASPALSGTVTGNFGFSGNITHSGQLIESGTSAPSSAGGNTVVMGTITSPTLSNTGQAFLYNTVVNGAILEGDGSTNDVSLFNKSGTLVAGIPTGTTKLNFPSLASGTCSSGLGLDSGNNTILISCPGAASSIQVGTTTVTSGTNNFILTSGTGTLANVSFASLQTAPVVCDIISTSATTCNNGGSAANNGTYTTPSGALYLEVKWCGGGAGGGGSGATGTAGTGTVGNNTTFGTSLFTGNGGGAGAGPTGSNGGVPGAGGSSTGGYQNLTGQSGASGGAVFSGGVGGSNFGGGSAYYGGGGTLVLSGASTGGNGISNSGGGGSGGGDGGTALGGGGGGGGGCGSGIITSPSATYSYAVAAAASGGTLGTSGAAGGNGAAGHLTITARFQ